MKKVKFLSLVTAAVMTLSSMPIVAQASGVSADEEWKAWDSIEIADTQWRGNDAEVSACVFNSYLSTTDYKTPDSGTLFTINKEFKKGETYEISFKVRSYEDEQRRSIRIWAGTSTSTKNDKLCYRGALDGATADGLPIKDGCEISHADGEGWYLVNLTYTAEKNSALVYLIVSGDTTSNNDKYNASGLLPMDFDDFKLGGNLIDGGDFSMGETTVEFEWRSFKTEDKLIDLEVKSELTAATSSSGAAPADTAEKYLTAYDFTSASYGMRFKLSGTFNKGTQYDLSFKIRAHSENSPRTIRIYAATPGVKKELDDDKALLKTTILYHDAIKAVEGGIVSISEKDVNGWHTVTVKHTPENSVDYVKIAIIGGTSNVNNTYTPAGNGVSPLDFDDVKINGKLVDGGDFTLGETTDEFKWGDFYRDNEYNVVSEIPYAKVVPESISGGAEYIYRDVLNPGEYVLTFKARLDGFDYTKGGTTYDPALAKNGNYRYIGLDLYQGGKRVTEDFEVSAVQETGNEFKIGNEWNDNWVDITYKFTVPEGGAVNNLSFLIGSGASQDARNIRAFDIRDAVLYGENLFPVDSDMGSLNTGILMVLLNKKHAKKGSTEGTVEVKNSYLATDEYKTPDSGTLFTINKEFKKGETYELSFRVRSYEDDQRRSIRIWAGTSTSTKNDKLYYQGALDGTTADGLPKKDGCEISHADGEGWYLVNLKYQPENDSELLYLIVSGDYNSNNDKYNASGLLPMDFDDFKLGGKLLAGGDFSKGKPSNELNWVSFKTGEKVINLKVKDETVTVGGEAASDSTTDKNTGTYETVEVENRYLATDEYKTLDSGTLFTINQDFKKGETYDISFKVRSYENEQRRSIRIWAGTSTSTGKDKLCYRGALDGTTADGLPIKDGCEISPIDGEGWYLVNLTYQPENDSELLYVIVSGDTTSNNEKYNGSGVLPMDFDDFKLGGKLLAGGDFSNGDASDEFKWASFKTGEKVINLKVKQETVTVVSKVPVDDTDDKDTDTEVTVESAR